MEIIYIITMQIFTAILIVGLIIYSNLTTKKTLGKIDHGTTELLNKIDLETKEMLAKIERVLIKIEHEIKNEKATQSMLNKLLDEKLPQND